MSVLAIPLMVASTAMAVVGQVQAGKQASDAQERNALIAENEAKAYRAMGDFQSETLKQQSIFEQDKIKREKDRTISAQRASYAKSGVRIDEGTPLEVQADTAAQFELDLEANRYNTAIGLEEIRYESESGTSMSKSESTYRKLLARQSKNTGYMSAGSTFLTGASKISSLSG